MRSFLQYIYFLFISLILGFSLSSFTKDYFIKPVDGFNQVSFDFGYLLDTQDITIKAYDENNEVKFDETKKLVKTYPNATLETPLIEALKYGVTLQNIGYLISINSSHKIEVTINGKGNIAIIHEVKCNNKTIPISSLIPQLESIKGISIGTSKDYKDVLFIKLNDDKATIDLTPIVNPVKLTKAEQVIYEADYEYLSYVYLGICVALVFIVLLVLSKFIGGSIFYYVLLVLASFVAINTAFFIGYYKLLVFAPGTFISNLMFFEMNYIPALLLIYSPFVFALFFKNKWIKAVMVIIPLCFIGVLLVDNALFNVLGVRFNFNFGTQFNGDLKYIFDFSKKYFKSISALLCLLSFILALIIAVCAIRIDSKIRGKSLIVTVILLVITTIIGVLPPEKNALTLKLSNVFQINGFSFYIVGNFNKDYDEKYEPRDTLDFKWENKQGLNQGKNVIILMVESWGCNISYICGKGPSYMPKLEKLAKENMFFSDYHSVVQSTSLSVSAVLKSNPVITLSDEEKLKKYPKALYKENDLIEAFKHNGYKTRYISSIDNVFGMSETISHEKFDEVVLADNKDFENIKERYVFNGISDEELFKYIKKRISNEKEKFLYLTVTATNHSPYNSPLGSNNMELAFKYTDNAVSNFIEELKKINYFDNGILVIFGDHSPWGVNDKTNFINDSHVPMLIIDGEHKGIVNNVTVGHPSVGVMLQYLMLPTFKMNRFNSNPLDSNTNQPIFSFDNDSPNQLDFKLNNKVGKLIFSGNDSYIEPKGLFSKEEEYLILGYVAWFK